MRDLFPGALAMGCTIAGIFFFKYWFISRDRLFIFFALAFWTLATNWIVLGGTHPAVETQHHAYIIRLGAFVLILIGILDKNRRT